VTSPNAAGPDRRSDRARTSSPGDELTSESTRVVGRATRVRARSGALRLERYYPDPWHAIRFAEHLTRAGAVVEVTTTKWREVRP